jgi:hypothetical protein
MRGAVLPSESKASTPRNEVLSVVFHDVKKKRERCEAMRSRPGIANAVSPVGVIAEVGAPAETQLMMRETVAASSLYTSRLLVAGSTKRVAKPDVAYGDPVYSVTPGMLEMTPGERMTTLVATLSAPRLYCPYFAG